MYASSIWDLHTQNNTSRVEAVQWWVACFVLNRYRNTCNVNTMLEALDWPTLERRHQMARLSVLYKIHNSLVHCPGLKSQPPPPPPPPASTEVMTGSSNSSQQGHSTGALPFCPEQSRIGKEWNCLPKEVVEAATLDTFMSTVKGFLPINPCNSPHMQGFCDWSCHKHASYQNMGCSSLFPD